MAVSLERLKVLVVDDNPHMVSIVKTILRGFGINSIYDARDGADARRTIRDIQFDLIIADFAMKPMDGCEFTRQLRCDETCANRFVPIIMLSAYAERSKVESARDSGITEFCAKPVTVSELYRKFVLVTNSPRPFVRTKAYSGPDRRRRKESMHDGPERREHGAEFPDAMKARA